MEVKLDSRRYYKNGKWIDITSDDLLKIIISKFNVKKISITWKDTVYVLEAEIETLMSDDIVNIICQEIREKCYVPAKVFVTSCSYSTKEMAKLKKRITFDKVFK